MTNTQIYIYVVPHRLQILQGAPTLKVETVLTVPQQEKGIAQ